MPSTYFQFHSLLQNSVIFFLKKHIFSIQLIFLIFWDIESNMMWNMSWFHLPYPFACISVVVHRSPWIWLWFSIRKTNIIKITFKFLLFAIKVRWTCFWNVKSHMCPMYLPNAWYPTVRVWLVNYLSCIWCLDLFKLDSWVESTYVKKRILLITLAEIQFPGFHSLIILYSSIKKDPFSRCSWTSPSLFCPNGTMWQQ